MSVKSQDLLEQVFALPRAEKEELIRRLHMHLVDSVPTAAEQAEMEGAWAAEYERRIAEADAHPEDDIDGEEVLAELNARIDRGRRSRK